MPTTFSTAGPELAALLAEVMETNHKPLHDAGVRVGILLAASDSGPAVKHGGYPALATMKVVSLKDRVHKNIDAEMVIDLKRFEKLTRAKQAAVLDHELSHIALKKYGYRPVKDRHGEPTGEDEIVFDTDDMDRPKLTSVKGDWNAGDGFEAVVRRHGSNAVEFLNIAEAKALADRAKADGEKEKRR